MNAMMAKELMNQDTDGFAALGAMLASWFAESSDITRHDQALHCV